MKTLVRKESLLYFLKVSIAVLTGILFLLILSAVPSNNIFKISSTYVSLTNKTDRPSDLQTTQSYQPVYLLKQSKPDYSNKPLPKQNCKSHKYKQFTPNALKLKDSYDTRVLDAHPNLPKFLITARSVSSSIPDILKIRWTGNVFQESWKFYPKFLLYSSHLDKRTKEKEGIVRIIALYDGKISPQLTDNYFCQMWYNETQKPVIGQVKSYRWIDVNLKFKANTISPYVINCGIPTTDEHRDKTPIAVSFVNEPCKTPSNVLQISSVPNKKDQFNETNKTESSDSIRIGVCGKALYYYNYDFSIRLIEWIEMMKAIGISKIILYKMQVHPNVEKVMNYYESEGIVKLIQFQYPPPVVNEGTLKRIFAKHDLRRYRIIQKMYLNDCLLRFKDEFDYLLVCDADEIPVLRKHKTLEELIRDVKKSVPKNKRASISLKWRRFFSNTPPSKLTDGIPEYFYTLRHNQRELMNASFINVKSMHDTKQVLHVDCHHPIQYVETLGKKKREMHRLSVDIAYMAHFTDKGEAGAVEEENFFLNFREKILEKGNFLIEKLGLLNASKLV